MSISFQSNMALSVTVRDSKEKANDYLETYNQTYVRDGVEYVIAETFHGHQLLSTDPQYFKQYVDTNLNSLEISDVPVSTDAMNNTEPVADEFSWTGQTTKLLLLLYQERKRAFRDPKIKKKLWSDIREKFEQIGYKNISEDCFDRKMRNMKKTYRIVININTTNAIQQSRNELLEALLKERNNRKEDWRSNI